MSPGQAAAATLTRNGSVYVTIRTGPGSADAKVRVTNETYGRILTTNKHFHQALDENPDTPVLLWNCFGSYSGVRNNESAAQVLHDTGVDRDIYSPKPLVGTAYGSYEVDGRKHEFSALVVDTSPGARYMSGDEPFAHYPAPRTDNRQGGDTGDG
ncbi:hypothetical protein [Nocardia sp. alder85J]|uniref:hypothetical protein n=1 Tax=Nocardia sp. alder85J TaxID=2862949 RepID=UPI002251A377|nr:hypothetical protein [Nocardia sp. alder85J]MCX4095530.1 hypothetical protein [Nocardia sp. alder85J]